jgi:hypothetical protein
MPDVWEEIGEKLNELAGGWASFVALGTFLLYLVGYLSTRFYLTVLGIGTDLTVLDERYFFAGAKFLVYLLSTIPLLALIALVPVGLIVAIFRRLNKDRIERWSPPTAIAIAGIVISTFFINTVMRQCFFFSNLLLTERPYQTELGFEHLLTADSGDLYCFFMILVAGTILTAAIWVYARSRAAQTTISRFATRLLAFFVIVQFLFLPINYGIYIQDRYLPRVPDLGDQAPLKTGQRAWLVWEGTNTFTYLVLEPAKPDCQTQTSEAPPVATLTPLPSNAASATPVSSPSAAASPAPTPIQTTGPLGRKLVSVQQKNLKATTILEYDHLFQLIFK